MLNPFTRQNDNFQQSAKAFDFCAEKTIIAITLCEADLPFPAKTKFSLSTKSRLLIIERVHGIQVRKPDIPWNDASGQRLREWLGVTKKIL